MIDRKCDSPAIAALAGRRIDATKSPIRFPLTEAEHVFNKLLRHFRHERVEHLVCSAACGADILALEAAEKIGIKATIILPFAPDIFRKVSVTDRPGNWGSRFDQLIANAHDRNNIIHLGFTEGNKHAFSETNRTIVNSAKSFNYDRSLAFVVWEGQSRGDDDSTAEFLEMARSQGFEKRTVLTIQSTLCL